MFTAIQYLIWHYFDVPREILRTWRNFLKFGLNYFSIPLLIRTFFSHWRRYRWSYGRGFDIGRYISVFFSNLISRVMGAAMRTFLILFGVFFESLIFLGGITIFLGWFFLPALLILGLIFGFRLLFS